MNDDAIYPFVVLSTTVVPIGAFRLGLVSYQHLFALVFVTVALGLAVFGTLDIVTVGVSSGGN